MSDQNAKLKLCPFCGKEMAINTNVCPHCGGKLKKPIYKRTWFIVLCGLLVLGGIGNLMDGKTSGGSTVAVSKSAAVQEVITYQKIDIDQIEHELKQNAARTSQNYLNKYVEFSGRLGNIDSDGRYFSVRGNGMFNSIHCRFRNKDLKSILLQKNQGDYVRVKGQVSDVGEVLGFRVKVDALE